MDIFTRLYLPNTVRQWHKATILEFYQIFWSHWTPQLRETYLQVTNKIYQTSSGAASNTDSMKIKTFMNIINYKRKVHNKTILNKKSEVRR